MYPFYIIFGNGTEATSFNSTPKEVQSTGNAGEIIQAAIDSLCKATSKYEGGGKIILIGSFNLWAKPLTIRNWSVDKESGTTLMIEGAGNTVLLFNGLKPGEHAITITEGARVDFRTLEIDYPQSDGGSVIRVDKGSGTIGAWKGVFQDLAVRGASTTDYVFYAENFFNFDFQRVSIKCDPGGKGSLWLHNNSDTTCFGNSKFQNLDLLAPDRSDGAALKISATNMVKPMNLNSFDVLNIGTNYYAPGQKSGIGILLDGAAATTFQHVDIEYIPRSIHIENGKRVIFQSGYIHPDGSNGVGIYCGKGANGCQFNLEVDADSPYATVVKDIDTYKEPNNYDLSLSGSAQRSKILIEQKKYSVVHVRSNGSSEQTNSFATLSASKLKLPVGNLSPQDGDVWIDGGLLKVRVGGITKTIVVK